MPVVLTPRSAMLVRPTAVQIDAYRKAADQTAIGTSFASITSLSKSMLSGRRYLFNIGLVCDADATTTGIDVSAHFSAATTIFEYTVGYWTSATAFTTRGFNTSDGNTASTSSNGATRRIFTIQGVIQPSADGVFNARAKRENVGSGPNVRAGSWAIYQDIT